MTTETPDREGRSAAHTEDAGAGSSTSPDPGTTRPKPRRWRRIGAAVGFLVLVGAGIAGYWYLFLKGIVSSDDARIAGVLVDVSPQIGGNITEVHVQEGDSVHADQVLFALDKTALRANLQRANALVAAAEARLQAAQAENDKALHGPRAAEIRVALAAKESADEAAQLAESEWNRAKRLNEQNIVTGADEQRARTGWNRAKLAQQEANDQVRLLRQGTRVEDIAASRARVAGAEADLTSAQAAVEQAQINLDYADVTAPFDGVVVRRWRDPGTTVAPGTPVVTLLDPSTLHVEANIEENHLGEIAVGDRVRISIDAYPDVELHGRVTTILRATNDQFSLIPSEGVSGTYIKVTQRIPVRISLERPPSGVELSPGLSVVVDVIVGSGGSDPPSEAAAAASSHE